MDVGVSFEVDPTFFAPRIFFFAGYGICPRTLSDVEATVRKREGARVSYRIR